MSSYHKKQHLVGGGNRAGNVGATWEFNSRNSQSHMQIRLNYSAAMAPRANNSHSHLFLALSLMGIKKDFLFFPNLCQLLPYFKKYIIYLSLSTLFKKTSCQVTF